MESPLAKGVFHLIPLEKSRPEVIEITFAILCNDRYIRIADGASFYCRLKILFAVATIDAFRGSTTVVRRPVKAKVAGSNPARGALIEIEQEIARFLFYLPRGKLVYPVARQRRWFGAFLRGSLAFLRFEPWRSLSWTGVRRFSLAQANFLRKCLAFCP